MRLGREAADAIVFRAIAKKPSSFEQAALFLLVADDEIYGNSNIQDGTPHGSAIRRALERHHFHPSLALSEGLKLSPAGPYYVGQKAIVDFTIRNRGAGCYFTNVLVAGGRDPQGQVADAFPSTKATLCAADNPISYRGELIFAKAGTNNVFAAARRLDGTWEPSIPAEMGVNAISFTVAPGIDPQQMFATRPTVALLIVVRVREDGFEYDGQVHRSLSSAVRAATGTPWNGFAFFGLGGRPGRKHGSHE